MSLLQVFLLSRDIVNPDTGAVIYQAGTCLSAARLRDLSRNHGICIVPCVQLFCAESQLANIVELSGYEPHPLTYLETGDGVFIPTYV